MNKILRWEISRKWAWMLLTVIVVTGLVASSATAETDTLVIDQSAVTNETRAIAVDKKVNVYVTGKSTGLSTAFDYATNRDNQQSVGSAVCAPPSWSIIGQPEGITDNVGIGSSDFTWELSSSRTFEGTVKAAAADIGIFGCLLDPDCNWVKLILSLADFFSFSKGEIFVRQVDLRLKGEPGAQTKVRVESTLDGLLVVGSFFVGDAEAKVEAELFAEPSGGEGKEVLKFDKREHLIPSIAVFSIPVKVEVEPVEMFLTVGDELHIEGKLRAESKAKRIPELGAAVGLSIFSDVIPIEDISNPGLRFKVSIVNVAPIVTVDQATVTVEEGQVASNSGTLCDSDGDPVTLTASVGTVTNNDDIWSWSFTTSDGPAESQTVTITADDGKGGTSQITFDLVVEEPFPCKDVTEIPSEECEALLALYFSTNGGGWANNTNWLETPTPSNWDGVEVEDGHVTELWLAGNNLTGIIPSALKQLSYLKKLDLANNHLYGTIPPELGQLESLEGLWLDRNRLSGGIPPKLGNLGNLQELRLYGNQLDGTIPPTLCKLSNLGVLDLSQNRLSGGIPPELGDLSNLWGLVLWGNQLSGRIPPELGQLTELKSLSLGVNQLTGDIPQKLCQLSDLEELFVNHTPLSGPLPLCLKDLPLDGQFQRFWYAETGLSEPSDSAFQAWLEGIPYRWSTGDLYRVELWAVEYRWGGYSFADWPIFKGWMNVRIENRGAGDAFNVMAKVTSWPANTPVPDPTVYVGNIPAGGSAWSGDPDPSFEIWVDMSNPGDPCDEIFWRIEYYDDVAGVHHVVPNVAEFPPGEGPCN